MPHTWGIGVTFTSLISTATSFTLTFPYHTVAEPYTAQMLGEDVCECTQPLQIEDQFLQGAVLHSFHASKETLQNMTYRALHQNPLQDMQDTLSLLRDVG